MACCLHIEESRDQILKAFNSIVNDTYSQVGIFEERDKVCLSRLLEGHDSARLESEVGLEILCNFTDETLEGELSDEELGGLW
jgi:hypothetical protein